MIGGNPWVLTTGCLAQLFYRGAAATLHQSPHVNPEMAARWSRTLSNHTQRTITMDDLATPARLAQALADAGDGALQRIRYHTADLNFHMPEQLDKNTGKMTSAYDLTWSYATVLKAMKARAEVMALL